MDRAALDVALGLGLPCGGWCPRGRLAEDGVIPRHYPLEETPSNKYPQRTRWNVRDSDGTLILTTMPATDGTAFTIDVAGQLHKPYLVVDLGGPIDPAAVHSWAKSHGIHVLNIAGPRESTLPGTYDRAKRFLLTVLTA